MGVRSPHEYLFGDRLYKIIKSHNGNGDSYGVCYFDKKLIGKKFTITEISKDDKQFIEVVKREYSIKKRKNRGERRLKKK